MNLWTNFSRLAQANVNHYNNHPATHIAIATVYCTGVVVATRVGIRRMAERDVENAIHRPRP